MKSSLGVLPKGTGVPLCDSLNYSEFVPGRTMGNHILIVEDEAIVAAQLSDTLERHGYTILAVCTSGRDAIAFAKENRPDLVLMDVRIEGDLNGIETAIVIQGHFTELVPIVFLTAMPSSKFTVLAAVEPYIYVNKPIRDEELLAAVERSFQKLSEG